MGASRAEFPVRQPFQRSLILPRNVLGCFSKTEYNAVQTAQLWTGSNSYGFPPSSPRTVVVFVVDDPDPT